MKNFDTDISQNQLPSAQREGRVSKLIDVEIEFQNGRRCAAIVTNLSKHGMGAKMQGTLKPFELITLIKGGYGRVCGEVRWVDGQKFGVLFAEPINIELFNFSVHDEQGHFAKQSEHGHNSADFDIHSSIGIQCSLSRTKRTPAIWRLDPESGRWNF